MKPFKFIPFFILLGFFSQVNSSTSQENWQEIRSRHFLIRHQQAPADFINNVQEAAERSYDEIIRDLGFYRHLPFASGNRIVIYIYPDQNAYMTSAQQEGWSQGVAYFRQKEIRTFPSAYGFFDTVLPHELGHIIFREFIGDNRSIPLWVDEGVAMYQERAKRWGAHKHVKQALADNQFIPLGQLSMVRLSRETPREHIELFYAESASVIYFLINELGQQRFVNLCRRLSEGTDFLQALHVTYSRFRTLDDLDRAWLNYLEKQ